MSFWQLRVTGDFNSFYFINESGYMVEISGEELVVHGWWNRPTYLSLSPGSPPLYSILPILCYRPFSRTVRQTSILTLPKESQLFAPPNLSHFEQTTAPQLFHKPASRLPSLAGFVGLCYWECCADTFLRVVKAKRKGDINSWGVG